ncbi:MAG: hypothetical protein R3C71_10370 [Candidatus Krumholzibacteriia bacterium]|nr:hypothetical protein [Candidatus Latescibacterota bacterium]
MSPHESSPYMCIDPPIGDQIWRLELPETDASLREQLEAHVSACQACQLLRQLDQRARVLARQDALGRRETRLSGWLSLRGWMRPPVFAGAALVAAALAALIMPPRPVDLGGISRGAEDARFLRPVEGEVVGAGRHRLAWTPVEGASGYRVELRDSQGERVWSGESASPSAELPVTVALEPGTEYRALLGTQPADLLPPGGVSVAFRVGSPLRVALHRLRWTSPVLQGVGLVAAGLLVLLSVRRLVT